jgi:hypothetical protein
MFSSPWFRELDLPAQNLARTTVSGITQIDERAKNAATDDMLDPYNENSRRHGEIDSSTALK